MPATFRTHNLRARHPKRTVRMPRHGAWDGIEVGGPAAAGFELVIGTVEGRFAGGAFLIIDISEEEALLQKREKQRDGNFRRERKRGTYVNAFGRHMLVILPRIGRLGALFADHAELLGVEHGLPFVVALFDGVVGHVAFLAAEEGAEEGDRGHGF